MSDWPVSEVHSYPSRLWLGMQWGPELGVESLRRGVAAMAAIFDII